MAEVTVLNTLAECKSLQRKWIKLVQSMEYPSPFVHPDWILSALQAHEKDWIPYFIQVKENNKLIAILPLYRSKAHLRKKLKYIGDCYYPDPLGLCCEADKRKTCIELIQKYIFQRDDWDVLQLNWLLHEEAEEWRDKTSSSDRDSGTLSPYLILPESFNVYLQSFKRKKRYNLNRSAKNFEKAGGGYFSATDFKEKQIYLKHLFRIHEKRSVERNIISSFSGRDLFQFHENLLRKTDNIWLRSLEIDRKVIAVLYGFLFQNRFFYYQIAHDPIFRKQSPGTVLLYKVIEECCNLGVNEFNFLQGDENYKWQWTKESRTLHTVTIYNRTLAGAMAKQKEQALKTVRKFLSVLK